MPLPIPAQTPNMVVDNYYKGKAIRQQLAIGEKNLEQADRKMELAEQGAAIDAQNLQLRSAELQLKAGEYVAKVGEQRAKAESRQILGISAGAASFKSDKEKLTYAETQLKDFANELPDDSDNKDKLLDMLEDGLQGPELAAWHAVAEMVVNDKYEVQGGQDGFTLAQGSVRYDAEGNEIANNPKPAGSDSSRQRDDEIADATRILQGMGVPNAEEEAIKQVDGKIVYSVDPAGGAIYRTDKLANGGMGKTVEVDIQGGERGPAPEVPQEETLWALADEATGIGPGAKSFLAKGIGPLGGYTADATTKAKARFSAAENTLIRAFSLNPRYPVAEQNRIKENIQIKPKFWDSADQMHSRMSGIRSFLEFERATAAFEATRPGIGRAQKTIEENTVADIDRFLSQLGEAPSEAPLLEDLPPIPDGFLGDAEDWRYMTPEARERASK